MTAIAWFGCILSRLVLRFLIIGSGARDRLSKPDRYSCEGAWETVSRQRSIVDHRVEEPHQSAHTAKQIGTVRNMKVQVRLGAVTGTAALSDHVYAADGLAGPNFDGAAATVP